MGVYVSTGWCKDNFNLTINCTVTRADANDEASDVIQVGDVAKGEFEGNPDISGVGVRVGLGSLNSLIHLSSFLLIGQRMKIRFMVASSP
jgi:hypothetical protein